MPIVLTINHQHYLVKSEKLAIDAMRALAGAVRLEYTYGESHKLQYWPDEDREVEVGLKTIDARQMFARDPRKRVEPKVIKQLGNGLDV